VFLLPDWADIGEGPEFSQARVSISPWEEQRIAAAILSALTDGRLRQGSRAIRSPTLLGGHERFIYLWFRAAFTPKQTLVLCTGASQLCQ
jgi:hypothetical protein